MQLADRLRTALETRERKRTRSAHALPVPPVRRVLAGAAAAAFVGWTAATLPFYPAGWSWGLAALAGILAALKPRLGLAAALGLAVLPLGNVSLGLAVVYAVVATAWLAATWNRSEEGLYPLAGAVLAPLGMALMLPAALLPVRRAVWRAVFGAAGVLLAGIAAGVSGATLPLSSREPSALAVREVTLRAPSPARSATRSRPGPSSCSRPLRSLRSRRSCRSRRSAASGLSQGSAPPRSPSCSCPWTP